MYTEIIQKERGGLFGTYREYKSKLLQFGQFDGNEVGENKYFRMLQRSVEVIEAMKLKGDSI